MTAHTPPTPPAARERKLETVCFEASTISVLTSSAEGNDDAGEEVDEEDMACRKIQQQRHEVNNGKRRYKGIDVEMIQFR